MTFILGLVAEPVPAAYVHRPDTDKMALAKGRQILEKYNCVGCHQVQPGIYELNRTPDLLKDLENAYISEKNQKFPSDYREEFLAQNEWTGRPSPFKDRFLLHAVTEPGAEPAVRLTQALQFTKTPDDVRDKTDKSELEAGTYNIPASSYVGIPETGAKKTADSFGGAFADLMVPYLKQMNGGYL